MQQPDRPEPDTMTPPLRDIGTDILAAARHIFDGILIGLFILVFVCWLFVASASRLIGFIVDARIYLVITVLVALGATIRCIRLWLSWRTLGAGAADGG